MGTKPEKQTVRVFLQRFDMRRRSSENIRYINEVLAELGLKTNPHYESTYIDGEIEIELSDSQELTKINNLEDPILRVSSLKAANNRPISVFAEDSPQKALSIMIANNFSQLPVIEKNEYGSKTIGLFTWQTYSMGIYLKRDIQVVRKSMKHCYVVSDSEPLEKVVDLILEHECVLVKDQEGFVKGIITDADLSYEFRNLSDGFLAVKEIESTIRNIINAKLHLSEIKSIRIGSRFVNETLEDVSKLYFSEYEKIFANDTFWQKLSLPFDRDYFISLLKMVKSARNDIMHFSKDIEESENYKAIYPLRQLLQSLDGVFFQASNGKRKAA